MNAISKLDKVFNFNNLNYSIVDFEDFKKEGDYSNEWSLLDEEIKKHIEENLNFEIWANELKKDVSKLKIEIFVEHDNSTSNHYAYVKVDKNLVGYLEISTFINEEDELIEVGFDFLDE